MQLWEVSLVFSLSEAASRGAPKRAHEIVQFLEGERVFSANAVLPPSASPTHTPAHAPQPRCARPNCYVLFAKKHSSNLSVQFVAGNVRENALECLQSNSVDYLVDGEIDHWISTPRG
jgi:hypothetical protein